MQLSCVCNCASFCPVAICSRTAMPAMSTQLHGRLMCMIGLTMYFGIVTLYSGKYVCKHLSICCIHFAGHHLADQIAAQVRLSELIGDQRLYELKQHVSHMHMTDQLRTQLADSERQRGFLESLCSLLGGHLACTSRRADSDHHQLQAEATAAQVSVLLSPSQMARLTHSFANALGAMTSQNRSHILGA